jgi:hypothetical protein
VVCFGHPRWSVISVGVIGLPTSASTSMIRNVRKFGATLLAASVSGDVKPFIGYLVWSQSFANSSCFVARVNIQITYDADG